jgi:hypothetical protein
MAQGVGKSAPTPPEPRKGRKKSRPKVTLVVGDAILLEKGDEFLLEGHAAVMLLPPLPGLGGILPESVTHSSRYGLSRFSGTRCAGYDAEQG